MGRSTTNTANWWAAVHALAILGQLSLCAAGTIAFASARPGWEDNMQSDDDEFWDDVTVNSTLPWISGAVGGLTTTINIIIFVVLYRTYRVSRARRFESQKDVFKTAVIVATIILLIVLFADLAIALDTGLAQLTAICGVASIGSIFTIATICADHIKLHELNREREKHVYVIELARASEEDVSADSGAPPSYETAVGAPK